MQHSASGGGIAPSASPSPQVPTDVCTWYLRSAHACAGRDGLNGTTAALPANNGSFFFVGDSMSLQHFRAAACQMLADVPAPPLAPFSVHEGSTCGERRDGSGRVCHVRAGANATGWTVGRAIAVLAALVHDGDVIIANEGLWHRALRHEHSTAASEVAAVRDLARGVDALRGRRVELLWRETTAQHFETPTGQHKPSGCANGRGCGTCRPVLNSTVQREHNERSNAVVRALGVPIVPIFEASLAMWDEHVARRGSIQHGKTSHALDCTHFCEPSRLFTSLTSTSQLVLQAPS